MGWTEKEKKEVAAWQKPKVGDYMSTPIGVSKVTHVTEYTWSGHMYGNIPFWEGSNWRVFKVIPKWKAWLKIIKYKLQNVINRS